MSFWDDSRDSPEKKKKNMIPVRENSEVVIIYPD